MDIRYGAIGDWFKGFAIISMWPLALIYFGVSFVNQSVRKLNLNFSYPLGPEDKNLLLTKVVTSQIESGKKWEVSHESKGHTLLSLALSIRRARTTIHAVLRLARRTLPHTSAHLCARTPTHTPRQFPPHLFPVDLGAVQGDDYLRVGNGHERDRIKIHTGNAARRMRRRARAPAQSTHALACTMRV